MYIQKTNTQGQIEWVLISALSSIFIRTDGYFKPVIHNFVKTRTGTRPNKELFLKLHKKGKYTLQQRVLSSKFIEIKDDKMYSGIIVTPKEAKYMHEQNKLIVNKKCLNVFSNIIYSKSFNIERIQNNLLQEIIDGLNLIETPDQNKSENCDKIFENEASTQMDFEQLEILQAVENITNQDLCQNGLSDVIDSWFIENPEQVNVSSQITVENPLVFNTESLKSETKEVGVQTRDEKQNQPISKSVQVQTDRTSVKVEIKNEIQEHECVTEQTRVENQASKTIQQNVEIGKKKIQMTNSDQRVNRNPDIANFLKKIEVKSQKRRQYRQRRKLKAQMFGRMELENYFDCQNMDMNLSNNFLNFINND